MGKVAATEKRQLEWWPIERPIPYARNARVIPDSAVGKVAASIKEFGFKSPIIVDGEGVIIAGHTRLLAAQRLGMETVPVIVADDLTPAQVKAYRLADNRTAQESTWDMDLLSIELEELAGLDIDVSLTGFDDSDLMRWNAAEVPPPMLCGEDALLHQWTLYFTDEQLAVMERAVESVRSSGAVDDAQGANAKAAAVAHACEVFLDQC